MSSNAQRRQIVQQLTRELRAWERAQGSSAAAQPGCFTAAELLAASAGDTPKPETTGSAPVIPSSTIPGPAVGKTAVREIAVSELTATNISTGVSGLDRLLPGGGLEPGRLVEWLAMQEGSGTETLALLAAREALARRGMLVVVDGTGDFYPPAAALWGIDLERLILVRPTRQADILWAVDQALRCAGVAAVLAGVGRLADRPFRRLQLAAEQGGGLGLLLRPGAFQKDPSWADVSFLVTPLPTTRAEADRRLCVEVLRCRGGAGAGGNRVYLEIDDETGLVHLVPERASTDTSRRVRRPGA